MNGSRVLVTGGAGYIGSHVVKTLVQAGYSKIVVLDNLSTGFEASVLDAQFILGNVQDTALVFDILKANQIDTVMHFAASTVIPDSITHPLDYYQNNSVGTLNLLQGCVKAKVKYFIFSSTAAVYGTNNAQFIHEDSPKNPTNPYGHSKLMSEQFVKDVAHAHDLRFAILRYFNVAGADPSLQIGQRTHNATHLIKMAVQTACGLHSALPIFGIDYPTKDGTCIRDFIHVNDLADAHLQALNYLIQKNKSLTLNCGYGQGFSVFEVIKAVEEITARPLNVIQAPKRNGDLPCVVADVTRIKQLINWQPKFADLLSIVKTAFDFEQKLMI